MKLFIGNIAREVTEIELRELLSEFEPILEIHRPHDRETGLPRKFAFVTLEDSEKGTAAIAELDGKEFAGRRLRVNEAEDRGGGNFRPAQDSTQAEERKPSGASRGGGAIQRLPSRTCCRRCRGTR